MCVQLLVVCGEGIHLEFCRPGSGSYAGQSPPSPLRVLAGLHVSSLKPSYDDSHCLLFLLSNRHLIKAQDESTQEVNATIF